MDEIVGEFLDCQYFETVGLNILLQANYEYTFEMCTHYIATRISHS